MRKLAVASWRGEEGRLQADHNQQRRAEDHQEGHWEDHQGRGDQEGMVVPGTGQHRAIGSFLKVKEYIEWLLLELGTGGTIRRISLR